MEGPCTKLLRVIKSNLKLEKILQVRSEISEMARFIDRYVETKKFQRLMHHVAKMKLLTRGEKMARPQPYQG